MAGDTMKTLFAYLWRLLVIALGFGAASLGSGLFFFLGTMLPEYRASIEGATQIDIVISTFFYVLIALPLFATLIGLPVLVLAALAEFFGIRGLLAHGVAGMLLGAAATLWLTENIDDSSLTLMGAGAAAGIVGACIYWLIAGRNAGKLFDRITAERRMPKD
jgi:hypothetical protein